MKKRVIRKVSRGIRSQASKEKGNARQALKGLSVVFPEIWRTLVSTIPKMIRLTVELIKSKKVSDRAKLILSGGICVIGFGIAEELVNKFTVVPITAILLGPISAFFTLLFYGTIKILLILVSFFIIAHTYINLIENEETERLANELFGDKESKEFLADVHAIYAKLKCFFDPFINKLCAAFEKIGKRKRKKFDPDVAGDTVIRSAKNNMSKLLELSDSHQSEISKLLTAGNENSD